MHHAGVPARARAPALSALRRAVPQGSSGGRIARVDAALHGIDAGSSSAEQAPPGAAAAAVVRLGSARSGLRLRCCAVSNGSLTCARSLRVSTSTSGPSSTRPRPASARAARGPASARGHGLLRRADLVGVRVHPCRPAASATRLQHRSAGRANGSTAAARQAARSRPAEPLQRCGLRAASATGASSAPSRALRTWRGLLLDAVARHAAGSRSVADSGCPRSAREGTSTAADTDAVAAARCVARHDARAGAIASRAPRRLRARRDLRVAAFTCLSVAAGGLRRARVVLARHSAAVDPLSGCVGSPIGRHGREAVRCGMPTVRLARRASALGAPSLASRSRPPRPGGDDAAFALLAVGCLAPSHRGTASRHASAALAGLVAGRHLRPASDRAARAS